MRKSDRQNTTTRIGAARNACNSMRKYLGCTTAPAWERLRTLHTAIGPNVTWGATAQGGTATTAVLLQRVWRAMIGQTLHIHREPDENRKTSALRRSEQVQWNTEQQRHPDIGEQAFHDYAFCVGKMARLDNTMASHMLEHWTPEHGETTWSMRARTQRTTHSTVVVERELVDYILRRVEAEGLISARWTDLAHDPAWWMSMCVDYAQAAIARASTTIDQVRTVQPMCCTNGNTKRWKAVRSKCLGVRTTASHHDERENVPAKIPRAHVAMWDLVERGQRGGARMNADDFRSIGNTQPERASFWGGL